MFIDCGWEIEDVQFFILFVVSVINYVNCYLEYCMQYFYEVFIVWLNVVVNKGYDELRVEYVVDYLLLFLCVVLCLDDLFEIDIVILFNGVIDDFVMLVMQC